MTRTWKFIYNWLIAAGVFNIILDAALILFLLAFSFIKLENMFPAWETLWLLGRITLVISALMATSYIFSKDGRKEWL